MLMTPSSWILMSSSESTWSEVCEGPYTIDLKTLQISRMHSCISLVLPSVLPVARFSEVDIAALLPWLFTRSLPAGSEPLDFYD